MHPIHLPNPCTEDWASMHPVDRGRFCNNCQKKVYDLTKASLLEVALLFKQHDGQLCGRIKESQLQSYNEWVDRQNSLVSFSHFRAALSSLSILVLSICTAPLKKTYAAPLSRYLDCKSFEEQNLTSEIDAPPTDSAGILEVRVYNGGNQFFKDVIVELYNPSRRKIATAVTDSLGKIIFNTKLTTGDMRVIGKNCEVEERRFDRSDTRLHFKLRFDPCYLESIEATGTRVPHYSVEHYGALTTKITMPPLWKRVLFFPYYQTRKVYWRLRN